MLGKNLPFEERAAIVKGPLAPLAASLAADLDRLLPDEDVFVPVEKARMTRQAGRCEREGAFLEFDPTSPRNHRCPLCGTIYDGDDHYRWWIMGYQLWLAERAVHAAALSRLTGTSRYRQLAEAILERFADRYLSYPNEDNVLGPTRVFFSTYLESIWSLQLSVAVWLLENGNATTTVGNRVRDVILGPSSELIAEFDEGLSNRQVWNSAALGAAGVLLGRADFVERALVGGSGLHRFLRSGIFSDGSWYEGENYHLFAHRGLWYLMMLAEHAGASTPDTQLERFNLGFSAPLKTALPDFTFPSRRDSQYRASLRQWRIAESLELGLTRIPHSRELAAGLVTLYGDDAPAGDSARWRSTAEAERNVPGVRLTRADLGWKALLFAMPELPPASAAVPVSAIMEGQGFGVIRRDHGRIFVALDYGHTGGSHGHPDRLNLWLVNGDRRIFEDVGTGSYVERTLHWYRSTLAHNAPLIDGRSQEPVDGSLRAWDVQPAFSWIDADAPVAPGVSVRRSVVVAEGYLIDRVQWTADREVTFDLPMHVESDVQGARWENRNLTGGSGLEDGFEFVTEAQMAESPGVIARIDDAATAGAVMVDTSHQWWRARAPGPPMSSDRTFLMVRARGSHGVITSVWSWAGAVNVQRAADGSLEVASGGERSKHQLVGDTWHVESSDGIKSVLGGNRKTAGAGQSFTEERTVAVRFVPVLDRDVSIGDLLASGDGLRFELGRSQYRRTEATWEHAGAPTATVMIGATPSELLVEVTVATAEPNFVSARSSNALDNEHPDTNSDGIQLHLKALSDDGDEHLASWLMVPEVGSGAVRVSGRDDAEHIPLTAAWQRTETGWQLLARIHRQSLGPADTAIGLDVIVNEMPSTRERRRGQLVMSANRPGWAYLRGDRQEAAHFVVMTVRNV